MLSVANWRQRSISWRNLTCWMMNRVANTRVKTASVRRKTVTDTRHTHAQPHFPLESLDEDEHITLLLTSSAQNNGFRMSLQFSVALTAGTTCYFPCGPADSLAAELRHDKRIGSDGSHVGTMLWCMLIMHSDSEEACSVSFRDFSIVVSRRFCACG